MQHSVQETTSLTKLVLPPIKPHFPDVNRDKMFVKSLEHSVATELKNIRHHNDDGLHKERHSVFKSAFGQVGGDSSKMQCFMFLF